MSVLVLIRDDGLRGDVVEAARAAGYDTDEARSTPEALERLAESGAAALLLELREGEDLGALDAVRELAPEAAVVAIGEDPRVDRVIDAFRRGARDFLRKPFDAAALARALGRQLGRPRSAGDPHEFLARDPSMRRLLARLERAAASDATVRLVGESGTGKDHLARLLHRWSARRHGPFVVVACAALAPGVAESELFGHTAGAFTGARATRRGRLRSASGGTLVLDEVGDLALPLQAKLLRVLQEREVLPVGARETVPVDTRFVATTRCDLAALVAQGRFREDLYYRLDVITLRVPPLRERPDDVPLLAASFLERFARAAGERPVRLSADALAWLREQPLRGNVRELENWMRRAALLQPGRTLGAEALARPAAGRTLDPGLAASTLDLRALERAAIERALQVTDGNRTAAARLLGISVRTLRNKLHRYGLREPVHGPSRGEGVSGPVSG